MCYLWGDRGGGRGPSNNAGNIYFLLRPYSAVALPWTREIGVGWYSKRVNAMSELIWFWFGCYWLVCLIACIAVVDLYRGNERNERRQTVESINYCDIPRARISNIPRMI